MSTNSNSPQVLRLPFIEMVNSKENLIRVAKLANQAERYEDMVVAMKLYAESGAEMSTVERDMLSMAYKNVVGSRRAAWRAMNEARYDNSLDKKPGCEEADKLISTYMETIKTELRTHCVDVLAILDKRIEGLSHGDSEAKICFLKMRADYQRYLCEICIDNERKNRADQSMYNYQSAISEAAEKLPVTHPLRLGLYLNFSVFYYEIMNRCDRACKIARAAFDDAIAELDTMSEETYRDSTIILQLLRDNIKLWESQQEVQKGQCSVLTPLTGQFSSSQSGQQLNTTGALPEQQVGATSLASPKAKLTQQQSE